MNAITVKKVIAMTLAFIISFANVLLLGSYVNPANAVTANLEEQVTTVNKAKIEFDAYFQNDKQEKTHSKNIKVEEEQYLYLSIKLQEGYLTNANVKITNSNFKVLDTTEQLDKVQKISSEENKITLNQISKDEAIIIKLPIGIKADSNFDIKDLSKQADITLEGTYVNNKGKEINVNKKIAVETSIDGTAESTLSAEVIKYVPFNVNGKNGVILQTSIKSKLVDNKLPVKTTKLEIEIPKINNIEPENITVSSKSTMATNGQKGRTFNEDEYKIEDGKITLEIQNNEEKLSWQKQAEDEFIVTYVYNEKAIVNKVDLELNAKSEITYYAGELKTANQEAKYETELTEKIGDLVTSNISTSKESMYKGYMLAQNGKNTEFTTKLELNIGYKELIDKLGFREDVTYVDEKGNLYPSNALYTYTKIDSEKLVEILGEDGFINIYNGNGELITTLNKDNLEYKYEKEVTGLVFETSKPVQEGILEIESGRAIKPQEYSKVQMDMFNSLKLNITTNIIKDGKTIINTKTEKNMALENTKTQAKIEIGEPNISTVVKTEGAELRVTLKTTDESTTLYKNPTIDIVLPKYITDIDIENVKLVYEKELKIASAQKGRNENGNIVIKIVLAGEQTAYNEEWVTEGATLVMNADITVNQLTPTKQEKIYLNVKNENEEEMITESTDIKFVAPAGIATVSQIMNYGNAGEITTTIGGNRGVGEISAKAPAKQATMKLAAINNYPYDLNGVVLLGRIPFEGNKNIVNGQDLGSTFTTKLISEIKSETGLKADQMKVYYSANGEATKEINDVENGWVTDRSLAGDVKSFMVVLDGYTFKTGEILGFSYMAEIPANLERRQNTFGTFAMYFEKLENPEEVTIKNPSGSGYARVNSIQTVSATSVGLSTGTGPDLTVELKSDLDTSQKITTRKQIKFTASVKNNSVLSAGNVNVKVNLPANMYPIIYNSNGTYIVDTNATEINIPIAEILSRRNKGS